MIETMKNECITLNKKTHKIINRSTFFGLPTSCTLQPYYSFELQEQALRVSFSSGPAAPPTDQHPKTTTEPVGAETKWQRAVNRQPGNRSGNSNGRSPSRFHFSENLKFSRKASSFFNFYKKNGMDRTLKFKIHFQHSIPFTDKAN